MSDIEKKRDLFANAPVKTAVCKQVIPAVAGMMVTLIYGLADTYFVGYVNDPAQTAALNVSGPCFLMLTAVSNLFGVGGASLIAQALGKKEFERAKEISVAASYCGAIAALFYSALMYLFMYPILQICGADSQSFPHASGYTMWTVVIGAFGTVMNILFGNLVRAEGDAVAASFGVTLGGVLNIFLDALFVLPRFLGMGAVGAGIATALSNYVAALYFIIYIIVKRKGSVISLSPSFFLRGMRSMGEICKIGFPSALQYALTVVAIAAQAGFVSKYGVEAEAGLGIVKKLDQLPLYFSIGVSNGLLPILAFNYAAENYVRQKDAFVFGCSISCAFAILCLAAYEIFAPALTGLFINDHTVVSYASDFLRLMVIAMPMMAVCYPLIIQFQAVGMVKDAIVCSVLRKGVLDIPLLMLMDAVLPLYGCMLVQPIVDSISLVIALFLYKRDIVDTLCKS